MNKKLRQGKSSELTVAGELIRHGLDVYLPCVDDQAIDLIVRVEINGMVAFYDIQVKSVAGYNQIIGVKPPEDRPGNYVLILHYRHGNKADEFFYLMRDGITKHHLKGSAWGDLVFNKAEREQYAHKGLAHLASTLLQGQVQPTQPIIPVQAPSQAMSEVAVEK